MNFEYSESFYNKRINPEGQSAECQLILQRTENIVRTLAHSSTEKISEIDPRDLLRTHLEALNLRVNPRLFFMLNLDSNFEIWSRDFRFLGAGNQLIRRLSYSIEELLTMDWGQLFTRDPRSIELLGQAVGKLLAGAEIVTDVCPLGSKRINQTV